MSKLLRQAAVLVAAWVVATAAALAVLAALDAEVLSGPVSLDLIGGAAVVAALLVPFGLGLLGVAERAAMRINAPSRILGAALLSALPCFGVVIVLERLGGILTPVEAVAFAAAGVVVGVVVGITYPWVRGPFPRRRRRRSQRAAESRGPASPAGD